MPSKHELNPLPKPTLENTSPIKCSRLVSGNTMRPGFEAYTLSLCSWECETAFSDVMVWLECIIFLDKRLKRSWLISFDNVETWNNLRNALLEIVDKPVKRGQRRQR